MSNTVYPFRITFPRTGDWYDSGGTWYRVSTWCNSTFGEGNWNYYGGDFVFEKERDFLLFKLKWSEHHAY